MGKLTRLCDTKRALGTPVQAELLLAVLAVLAVLGQGLPGRSPTVGWSPGAAVHPKPLPSPAASQPAQPAQPA